jgi:hypothetical protein
VPRCQDVAPQREGAAPTVAMPPPTAPVAPMKASSPPRAAETAVSETRGTG